jgi:nicotinamide-nucleotide adenylyltransferase/phosphinothricin biosynthesis protein PhpF
MTTTVNSVPLISQGCVNGRFQPPHKGHLEYILEAKRRCEFLWIGITRYDLFDDTPCDVATHRATLTSNPLTYYERTHILSAILLQSGIAPNAFGFTPFPIDRPTRIPQFVPTSVTIYTTLYDEWNRHKIKILEEAGYTVIVLWERSEKQYEGHLVREAIKSDSSAWESMVPASAVELIKQMQLKNRLTS